MEITKKDPVGQIAARHPGATRVFHRFGIEFCCGGGAPLEEACNARGVNPDKVLEEVRRVLADPPANEADWNSAGLGELIDHILTEFHAPLAEELPRLDEMTEKVARVHHDKDARLAELRSVYVALKAELESHMMKEEQILFPMIHGGNGPGARGPVTVMEHEHDSAGAALRRMRELTDGYSVPEQACNTWRAMLDGLEKLEGDLHRHIHLENNILFPRALGGEGL